MQNDDPRTDMPVTLCAPDQNKSCFACCPPIRPPGYEHLQYPNEIKRLLRENTASLRKTDRSLSPITGFSCWALGYLDGGFKRIGCLLHPSQNHGDDLRFRVDYGDKCSRESCVEAVIFAQLSPAAKDFWLRLSDGLDSFSYSSRSVNPLFRILGWGAPVLTLIAAAEKEDASAATSILETHSFFKTTLSPRANAYLLRVLVTPANVDLLRKAPFRGRFEELSGRLCRDLPLKAPGSSSAPYVHSLPMDSDFLDFLRLGCRIARLDEEEAASMKEVTDHELARFRNELV